MTSLSERNGPNCDARTCGFIIAHWAGAEGCDHYNIRERSGSQFEAPGTNRDQLHNQRSAQFPGRFTPNNTIRVRVQGCTRNLVGVSSCTAWSNEVSFRINDSMTSPKGRACERYARRAVGSVTLARDTYKCDPKVISGPRWSSNLEEHRNWCMTADAKTVNFEDRERNRIMHECRLQKPTNALTLTVAQSRGGDDYTVTGRGFPANAPVVLRLSGAAARTPSITTANNQLITANAQGTFTVRLFGAMLCKGAGQLVFVAEERDQGRQSNRVVSKCTP